MPRHFRGRIAGHCHNSANSNLMVPNVTRARSKAQGLAVSAGTQRATIETLMWHDAANNCDRFEVLRYNDNGTREVLSRGVL